MYPRYVFWLALLLLAPCLAGAQSYRVVLHAADGSDSALQRITQAPAKPIDAAACLAFIQRLPPQLQNAGYLAASVDSFSVRNGQYEAWVFTGRQYRWARLSFTLLPPALLTEAVVIPGQWEHRALSPAAFSRLTEKILGWCENNGYPFARLSLDSLQLQADGGLSAALNLDKGKLLRIDSITVTGDVHLAKAYLVRYLDITEGAPYDEHRLLPVSARLRELPFLQEATPWDVHFGYLNTKLELHLKERKANQLNAIIGLQPNTLATGKFLLTIDASAAFQNILGYGESLSFSFQNLQPRSPNLKADVVWPYLLGTRFGAEAHFELYKSDTLYDRISLDAGTRYQLSPTEYLKVFYQNRTNHLITIDTAFVRENHRLPDNADVAANGGGAEGVTEHTDYRPNPRRGWTAAIRGAALLRTVKRADAITELNDGTGFDYGTLYDTLEQAKYQYRLSADAAYYIPLAKKLTLKTAYDGGYVSGAHLFQNELYQIGGFKLLRGFDELSVYASQYHIVTAELRLLLNRNSYTYLFSDNAWVQSKYNNYARSGFYNGFGVGATLETKTGLFTIAYALGRSDFIPFSVKQSKIHFGYVALF